MLPTLWLQLGLQRALTSDTFEMNWNSNLEPGLVTPHQYPISPYNFLQPCPSDRHMKTDYINFYTFGITWPARTWVQCLGDHILLAMKCTLNLDLITLKCLLVLLKNNNKVVHCGITCLKWIQFCGCLEGWRQHNTCSMQHALKNCWEQCLCYL